MKKGIEIIEKRNMNLDIQEKNQSSLHSTLRSVLDSFKLDADRTERRNSRTYSSTRTSPGRTSRRHCMRSSSSTMYSCSPYAMEARGPLRVEGSSAESTRVYEANSPSRRKTPSRLVFHDIAQARCSGCSEGDGAGNNSYASSSTIHRDCGDTRICSATWRLDVNIFLDSEPSIARP